MTSEEYAALYEAVLKDNDMKAPQAALFGELTSRLVAANAVMNLTAIRDPAEMMALHYADCLRVAPWIPTGAKVMDVGTGAGFPALPLAVIRPDLRIVALDSTAKKLRFVKETAEALGLMNLRTLTARAEKVGREVNDRERYDVVLSRAVAAFPMLAELCLPMVKIGGKMIALKGSSGEEELAAAQNAIRILGGALEEIQPYTLHCPLSGKKKHTLIILQKVQQTPPKYPRDFTAIRNKPL